MKKTIVKILPSQIRIENNEWSIDANNSIVFDSSEISFYQKKETEK